MVRNSAFFVAVVLTAVLATMILSSSPAFGLTSTEKRKVSLCIVAETNWSVLLAIWEVVPLAELIELATIANLGTGLSRVVLVMFARVSILYLCFGSFLPLWS